MNFQNNQNESSCVGMSYCPWVMCWSSKYVLEFYHVVSVTKINWVDLLGAREKNSVVTTVGVFLCVFEYVQVYVSSCVRYCVEFSHMFVRSRQNGCAYWWVLIVEGMAPSTVVCQFLCIGAMNDLHRVIMRRMFDSLCGVQ